MNGSKYSYFVLIGFLVVLLTACKTQGKIVPLEELEPKENYFIASKNLSHMQIDNIGNIFLVKNNRNLQKYTKEGVLDKTYDFQSGGFIHSIDALNPLYILIFYKDAAKITLLDRNLAVLHEIKLGDWIENDITAVCLSNDNRLWLYDNTERKLKKYSIQGDKLLESLDIYGTTNLNTNVSQLVESGNIVYMRNEEGKLIIMNNLGQYIEDKDIETGLALSPRKNQLCCPVYKNYSCLRMDGNPFQQIVPIENLHEDHLESFLYKFELYQIIEGGVLKSPIIRK